MPGASYELRWSRPLNRKKAGDRGEEFALQHLLRLGYTLVERNYRTRYGELDLILRHGDTLVFVEGKLRRGTGFGDPLEAVTERKQTTIRAIAEQYIAEREPKFEQARFDVVGYSPVAAPGASSTARMLSERGPERLVYHVPGVPIRRRAWRCVCG